MFSEEKIYPGHGLNFVRKDMKLMEYSRKKNHSLHTTDRKALNLRWTKIWRRAHKKESVRQSNKKEKKRTVKFC